MSERRFDVGHFVMGLVFIGIGVAFLLERLDLWTPRFDVLLPAAVIAIGVAVLLGALLNRSRA